MRDMSDRQFLDALKRNGFSRPVLFWVHDKTDAAAGVSFGMLVTRKGKILKRATIAKLIKDRAEYAEKRKAAAAKASRSLPSSAT